MDARFGSKSPYFRVFADGKSASRLDGIDRDNFQKAKLLPILQYHLTPMSIISLKFGIDMLI